MIGRAVGFGFATARDAVARVLIAVGATPNALTLVGMALTLAAGACYALGGGSDFGRSLDPSRPATLYPLLALALLVAASGCDMLDGAVARIGGKGSAFGAFLDSTMDRFSDFAIFAGMALFYARPGSANLTYVFLAMLAFANAFVISYARARAEDLIESCSVGYWQRGERSAAILIATAAHNLPALLIQQAVFPLFTVLRRVLHTRAVLAGRTTLAHPRDGRWWQKIQLWRWPRMSPPYDVITGLNILWLIVLPVPAGDPLARLLGAA